MKIPGNHPSFWQASRKLVFILSSQLFIASCKAAPAHSQCIRQSVWAEWDKDARRISARIDRGDTLSPRCPISCSPGTEVRVGGDHWVAAFWQILYTASQLRWCLFKCKGSTRLADSAAIRALEWTGGGEWHTNTHSFLREPCTFADGKKRAHRALWRKADWIMCEGWGSETTTGDLTNQPVGELKVQREAKLFMRAQLLT